MQERRGCLSRLLRWTMVLIVLTPVFLYFYWVLPFWGIPFNEKRHGTPPSTPAWALECWLWEDDVNTADAVHDLLRGYEEHDFPVRTILIDSPWSTRYNDFIVDEERYPNPTEFFGQLQEDGYRVVLWMTPMVDSRSKDTAIPDSQDWFDEAKSNGYLAGNGQQTGWWKGRGGFIDYANPDAMTWWRGLQQDVFDWGIDGWKLDGAATLFGMRVGSFPVPYMRVRSGVMTTRTYMDHYYRDEYQHGLTQNPEFITLSRSTDRFGMLDDKGENSAFKYWLDTKVHAEGFAPIDASPVNWVGDQDHAWRLEQEGIEEAIADILRSAAMGYNVIGSDVAGYSGGEFPPGLYARWAQFSTFCGLFMNGGHTNRALWESIPDEWEIVRTYAWLHTELVPYMYTHVVACHLGGPPLMRPLEAKYQYMLGDDILVAPIYEDAPGREVTLPEGTWRFLFDDDDIREGPDTFTRSYPLDEYPAFIRDGAIIPLDVKRAYTGYGDEMSEGYLTWLIYPRERSQFEVVHPDGSGRSAIAVDNTGVDLDVRVGGVEKPHILRIKMDAKPASVTIDGVGLQEDTAWTYEAEEKMLVIRTRSYVEGHYVIKRGG